MRVEIEGKHFIQPEPCSSLLHRSIDDTWQSLRFGWTIMRFGILTRDDLQPTFFELGNGQKRGRAGPHFMSCNLELPFVNHHAIIIGIDSYLRVPSLRTAVNDARTLADVLSRTHGFSTSRMLLDASKADIVQLLDELPGLVGADDRLLFYFAGHGIGLDAADGNPEGYLIPADASPSESDTWIPMSTLKECLHPLPCRHLLCILDCCFAGTFRWSIRHRHVFPLQPKRMFRERFDRYIADPAWQVLTSAAHDQKALDSLPSGVLGQRDNESNGNSPFIRVLLRGLADAADPYRNGLVTATQLYVYVREQVEAQSIDLDENLRQTPSIFPMEKHDKGEFIFLLPYYRSLPKLPKRNPYKQYAPFTVNDADLLFGRGRVVREIQALLEVNKVVAVTAGSGLGKTSVLQAGLIPALCNQGFRVLPVVRPGGNPIAALVEALDQSTLLREGVSIDQDLHDVCHEVSSAPTALILDQAEQLGSGAVTRHESDRFSALLHRLLDADRRGNLRIVVAIRSASEELIDQLFYRHRHAVCWYRLPTMTVGELREIAYAPAAQEVLHIESADLFDRDISLVANSSALLPHFSALLFELYESNSANRSLKRSDHENLNGVIGLLHRSAEAIHDALDENHRLTMRKILLRMVSITEGTVKARRVALDELELSPEENPRVAKVTDLLVAARVMTLDSDDGRQAFLSPAHHALLHWQRLASWIQQHERSVRLLTELVTAVRAFRDTGDRRRLWHGRRQLNQLDEELSSPRHLLNQQEIEFAQKSRAYRRRRWMVAGFSTLLLALVAAGLLLRANTISRAAELAAQAQQNKERDPETAIRQAYRAASLHRNDNIDQVLCEVATGAFERPFASAEMAHEQSVNQALFSPNDRYILTVSNDKTAILWDLRGHAAATLPHERNVYTACFSPDGRRVLTVSRESKARLWSLNGQLLHELPHGNLVSSAVFSNDGRLILTASQDDTARLWDVDAKLLAVFTHTCDVVSACFVDKGNSILTLNNERMASLIKTDGITVQTYDNIVNISSRPDHGIFLTKSLFNVIRIWNNGGSKIGEVKDSERVFNQVAFTPEGARVLTGHGDGAVSVWSFQGQLMGEIPGHGQVLTSMSCSPDGRFILTSSADSTSRVWNDRGDLQATLRGHGERVNTAAFSSDGRMVVTASRDCTARLWKLDDQPARAIALGDGEITSGAFSPTGQMALAVTGSMVTLVDLKNGSSTSIDGHECLVSLARFSPDGKMIVTASTDGTAKIWDLEGNLLVALNGHTEHVSSAEFSPCGSLVLTASFDGTAKLWNLDDRGVTTLDEHQAAVNRAVFSPHGKYILTASHGNAARLWDLEGRVLKEYADHSWPVTSAVFSSSGVLVLTLSVSPRLWDLEGHLLAKFEAPRDVKRDIGETGYSFAGFTPDDSRVVAIGNDNTVYFWSQDGGFQMRLEGHSGRINTIRITQAGDRAVTSSDDGLVGFWDLLTGEMTTMKGHSAPVLEAGISMDGATIFSISTDNTLRMWSTPISIIDWFERTNSHLLQKNEIRMK